MTTKDFARAQFLLERIRKLTEQKDELKFLRQSERPLWLHAGDSHATVMQVPPELCGHLLDMLDGHVEQEKKNAEEEFEKL